MWIITGVLVGLVCLATVFGFHAGPHAHGVAGALGVFAGGCLVYLLIEHGSGPGLWSVLGVDLLSSAGLAVLGWKGVSEYKEEVLEKSESDGRREHAVLKPRHVPRVGIEPTENGNGRSRLPATRNRARKGYPVRADKS